MQFFSASQSTWSNSKLPQGALLRCVNSAASARKLDLEVGTNADGKARFEGLPEKTKRGLSFQASHEDLEATAFVDPAKTCNAQLTLTLRKKSQ